MPNYQKTVWIKTSFVGFHCWPDAPAEVSYLRSLHRHTFNVRVCVSVDHSDRAVEFHLLKERVENCCTKLRHELSELRHLSCEMLAESLTEQLLDKQLFVCSVQVDEDGECGAEIFPSSDYVLSRIQNLPRL